MIKNAIYTAAGGKKIQSDWLQSDSTKPDYIKNKPDISGAITRQIVETLPTEDIDPNCIYMIAKTDPETGNYYDEYMYINNMWELIGNTAGGTAKNVFYGYTTNNSYNLNATVPDFTLEDGNIAIITLHYATGNWEHHLTLNINSLGSKEVRCYNGGSAEYLYNNGYNRNDVITLIYQSSGDYFIMLNRWRKNDITTYYFNCTTAAATAQKSVTAYTRLDPFAGQIIGIAFTNTNTAENPIISTKYPNGGDGQRIKYNGQVVTTSNLDKAGKAGHVTYYMFDGSYWVWMGEDNAFSGDYNDLTNKPTIQTFVNLGAYDFTTKLFENTVDFSTIPVGTICTFKYKGYWLISTLIIENNKYHLHLFPQQTRAYSGTNVNTETPDVICIDTIDNYTTASQFNVGWFTFQIGDNNVVNSTPTTTKTSVDGMSSYSTYRGKFRYLTDTHQLLYFDANNAYKLFEPTITKVYDGADPTNPKTVVYCTQSEFDALTPDANTIYYIK